MRSRWTRRIAMPLFATSLAACGDSLNPGGSPDFIDLAMDFCAGSVQAPVIFAYLDEDNVWTRVTADVNNTFSFRAPDRTGIAMVFQDGSDYSTEVIFAKNEELEPISGGACTEIVGTKSLNGSVSNVPLGNQAHVTMALSTASVFPPPSGFVISELGSVPLDLVAHRELEGTSGATPNRVIVRRALNVPHGGTIADLDFGAAEAVSPVANTLNINGLSSNEDNLIDVYFTTATAIDHPLYLSPFFTSSTQTLYHVPSSLTQAGDQHLMDVYASSSSGTVYRGETHFYQNGSNRTATLGAGLATPSVTTVASTPRARLRMELTAQTDYDDFVFVFYSQNTSSGARSVSVMGTADYFNSPSTWRLDVPDLTGVTGYPVAAGLQSGTQTSWQVVGYGGELRSFFGAAADGATLRYASRSNSTTAAMALRAGDASARSRSTMARPSSRLTRASRHR